jgi:hypothetical protein
LLLRPRQCLMNHFYLHNLIEINDITLNCGLNSIHQLHIDNILSENCGPNSRMEWHQKAFEIY